MYNWSSAAYIYMRLSWLFLWPTSYRKNPIRPSSVVNKLFWSRPRAIVPYIHVDRDNILLRWYQLPCRSCTATDGSTHSYCVFVYECVCARDFFFLVASINLGSPTPPLWHAVDLFGPALGSWHPKKVSQHHPPVTHTHTGLIRKERRKSKSFCKTSAFGLYVYIIYMRLGGFWTPSE